jgi:ribosomal protein S18 acetylase RimI-like enzyme
VPVGYGELWCDDREVELARLIVAPAVRGQGVGRRLVDELVRVARQSGQRLIFLRVHPDNKRAIRLYLGLGFRRQDALTEAEWNAGQPQPYWWFVR